LKGNAGRGWGEGTKGKPQQSSVAVIPCLNEAAAISRVVRDVTGFVAKVLVVDDGSTDATMREAQAAGADVLRHETPEGKGAALADGFSRAAALGFVWALALDGDGQHAAADIPKFFQAAEQTGANLIIGNRMPQARAMPLVRRWVNRWMSRRLSRITGVDLPDTQCGFRLVNLAAWQRLHVRTRHFEFESEMLLSMVRAGERVEFVPIQVIYKSEQSKIHPVRDTIRWFRWLKTVKGE
jgi:glycosyltransferase involved in cell wall biosynthesis